MYPKLTTEQSLEMIKSFFRWIDLEAKAINECKKNLDDEQIEKALKLIQVCDNEKGKLIFTGVGKSGIVARKIAATFSSLGLTSIYLNPLDALHGDIGIVASIDICFFISNSGETHELVQLLPHLKKREVTLISIVGRRYSTLAKNSICFLQSKVDREVCPLNLAPSASTTVAMAIGDSLAAVSAEIRGVSTEDFALNHPLGILGKKLTITVSDLMIPVSELNSLDPKSSFQNLIGTITKDGIGCGYVVNNKNDNHLLGIITDGDLRRALEENSPDNWSNLIASDLMTVDPITLDKNMLASEALQLMENNSKKKTISIIPIVKIENDFKKLLGILRLHDLIKEGIK